jgi:large subunit ribosomal protein LP2
MIEVAALLLCKLGGQGGSLDEIKAVLTAAGVDADDEALTKLSADMEGKDINELLAAGAEKIKDVPFGGGGGGGGGGGMFSFLVSEDKK